MEDGVDLVGWGKVKAVGDWRYDFSNLERAQVTMPEFLGRLGVKVDEVCVNADLVSNIKLEWTTVAVCKVLHGVMCCL